MIHDAELRFSAIHTTVIRPVILYLFLSVSYYMYIKELLFLIIKNYLNNLVCTCLMNYLKLGYIIFCNNNINVVKSTVFGIMK